MARAAVLGIALALVATAPAAAYRNPLVVERPDGSRLETFADPSVLQAWDGTY